MVSPNKHKTPLPSKVFPLEKRKGIVSFQGVTSSTCAVAVFHGANNDGKLNTNALGIPKETKGFSNNAGPLFSAPSFKEAEVLINKSHSISIGLN